jgi:squalene cyclase
MPALRREPAYRPAYERAKTYILATQLEDGSWYTVEDPERNHTSAQLQTALMLNCLLGESDETSWKALAKGLHFLLATQLENGSWDGGFFPIPNQRYKKREYIFATALICEILRIIQPPADE